MARGYATRGEVIQQSADGRELDEVFREAQAAVEALNRQQDSLRVMLSYQMATPYEDGCREVGVELADAVLAQRHQHHVAIGLSDPGRCPARCAALCCAPSAPMTTPPASCSATWAADPAHRPPERRVPRGARGRPVTASLDVDALLERWANLRRNRYSDGSLNTYKTRFRQANCDVVLVLPLCENCLGQLDANFPDSRPRTASPSGSSA